jgi:glycosyltransferase involved in cell wall biosynthesis
MRVLIATDAWHPQVNGVVRTLTSLARSAKALGVDVEFLSPDGFPTVPVPTYPGLRLALPSGRQIKKRIESADPDAIHIATEGPIGHRVRVYCLRRNWRFTTSYTTRFPEYISARWPIPEGLIYAGLRRFHGAASVTMIATPSLEAELKEKGFRNLGRWTRGVDTDLFRPDGAACLDLPRPIFMNVGRIAVEKNLEAFLSLDLPGTKVVIGDGPQENELKRKFPEARFLGLMEGKTLAAHIAAADVFVFPSLTDTFGIVLLEALASGLPVAAFPVTGPIDVIGGTGAGVIDWDLRAASLACLAIGSGRCIEVAERYSWAEAARQFMSNLEAASCRLPRVLG